MLKIIFFINFGVVRNRLQYLPRKLGFRFWCICILLNELKNEFGYVYDMEKTLLKMSYSYVLD
jgi:hypothetical protein